MAPRPYVQFFPVYKANPEVRHTKFLGGSVIPLKTIMQNAAGLEKVRQAIKDFRRTGQYIAGHSYISSLAPTLRQEKAIAIDIAQLYLVQGHYIRAWEACSLPESTIFVQGNHLGRFTPEICQADSVCLAILSAYIGISRHGLLKTALQIADRVYDAWLAPSCEWLH